MSTVLDDRPSTRSPVVPWRAGQVVRWEGLSSRVWNPSWEYRVTGVWEAWSGWFVELDPIPPNPAPRHRFEFTETPPWVAPSSPTLAVVS